MARLILELVNDEELGMKLRDRATQRAAQPLFLADHSIAHRDEFEPREGMHYRYDCAAQKAVWSSMRMANTATYTKPHGNSDDTINSDSVPY